jgi:hypothetical protein
MDRERKNAPASTLVFRLTGWLAAAFALVASATVDWTGEPAAAVFFLFQGAWFALLASGKSTQTTAIRWLHNLLLLIATGALMITLWQP